ncbi:MAG: cytochrome c oxidase subunit II [Actinomycetota bacterium]
MRGRSTERTGRWRLALPVTAITLLLAACGDKELPQDALDPQGPYADKVYDLAKPVFIIAGFVFVLVQALVIYSAVKFRRRSDDERPVQVHGNVRMELTWTIIPAAVLAVVGVLTVGTIVDLDEVPEGADVVHVDVVGHQWWWEYRYPDHGVVTANELHIPVGVPIAINLESVDVIHSFWVPKLAGKIDAIPNRSNHMTLQAETPGTYFGQCAEFCGLSHGDMRLRVVAHEPADFEKWVASNVEEAELPTEAEDEEAAAGAALFRAKGCASCHTVKGFAAGEVGPDLTHLQQRKTFAGAIFDLNEKNMRAWLRNPPEEKPGSIMPDLDLTEEEITSLIAYLDTLD